MNFIADLHAHTNVSDHALSSFEEMLAGSKRKGHIALAITNHGPALSDGAMKWHFSVFKHIPKIIDGIAIIGGAEANILDDGSIDIDEECYVSKLDYVIASMHESTCLVTGEDEILQTYLRVLENPYVSCFGHMGTPRYKFDYEKLISKCNEYKKIIEINCGSFISRPGSPSNCKIIASLCKKYNVPVVLTSDAHYSGSIGNFELGLELLDEVGYNRDLIINSSQENLDKYFKEYRGIDIFNR